VAKVLGIGLARQQNARALVLRSEGVRGGPEGALEDVVGEHHADTVAVDEPFRESERLGDPARLLLVRVQQPVDPVLVPVAEQAEELPGVRPTGDEHQLGQARAHERLDRVADHRAVVDREQVLVRDAGQGIEPGARSAREDDAFHGADATRGRNGPGGGLTPPVPRVHRKRADSRANRPLLSRHDMAGVRPPTCPVQTQPRCRAILQRARRFA
jgi:hypothetical protein